MCWKSILLNSPFILHTPTIPAVFKMIVLDTYWSSVFSNLAMIGYGMAFVCIISPFRVFHLVSHPSFSNSFSTKVLLLSKCMGLHPPIEAFQEDTVGHRSLSPTNCVILFACHCRCSMLNKILSFSQFSHMLNLGQVITMIMMRLLSTIQAVFQAQLCNLFPLGVRYMFLFFTSA